MVSAPWQFACRKRAYAPEIEGSLSFWRAKAWCGVNLGAEIMRSATKMAGKGPIEGRFHTFGTLIDSPAGPAQRVPFDFVGATSEGRPNARAGAWQKLLSRSSNSRSGSSLYEVQPSPLVLLAAWAKINRNATKTLQGTMALLPCLY